MSAIGPSVTLELVKPELLQTPSDIMPEEFDVEKRFEVIIDNREESINIVINLVKQEIVWFADAFKTIKVTGRYQWTLEFVPLLYGLKSWTLIDVPKYERIKTRKVHISI